VALATEQSLRDAADEVARTQRSRYPVYATTLDEVVGMVHAKDILTALRSEPEATVGTIMRPPIFVPGTREVEDVLADMKRLKIHLAIVLDEYGGTAGLVTMEDLLEEIVGPIFDEHDRQVKIAIEAPGSAPLVDGSMPISDFNDTYATEFDDTDYTTIGGLLFGQLGRLPQPGDRVSVNDLVFEIEPTLQIASSGPSPGTGEANRQFDRRSHASRVRGACSRDVERGAMVRGRPRKGEAKRHVHSPPEARNLDCRHPYIVVRCDHGIELAPERANEHGVGRQRTGGPELLGRGVEHAVVLVSEETRLPRMRIECADG
jgi:hypothetical protein